jgi:hypothetical protein
MSSGTYGDGQYDISARERRNIEERARIRAELRKEFYKQITNPHRTESGYLVSRVGLNQRVRTKIF